MSINVPSGGVGVGQIMASLVNSAAISNNSNQQQLAQQQASSH
jgi:hypothetical protein